LTLFPDILTAYKPKGFIMTKNIITLSSFVLLSSLLCIGCGGDSSNTDVSQTQSIKKKFTPPAHVVEFDRQKALRDDLERQGITLKTSSYSQDKASIYAIGLEQEQHTFYTFDAQTLNLIEATPILVRGTIDMHINEDGKVSIKTIEQGIQSNYLFDVTDKKLILKREEPAKTPQQIIQEQVGSDYTVTEFIRTPSTMGGLIMIEGKDGSRTLWLYGMENPKSPAREYAIFTGDTKDSIRNIQFLGNGIISYTHTTTTKADQKHLVTYDYFHKKQLKESWVGIANNIDLKALKEKIEPKVKGSVIDLKIAPSKLGAIVLSQKDGYKYISLFGLEDINNPKLEKYITASTYTSIKEMAIKEVQANGILVYTIGTGNKTVTLTCDYFTEYAAGYLKFETAATGEERLKLLLRAKKYSQRAYGSSDPTLLKHLEGSKYLITYEYSYFDSYQNTSVFDTSDASEKVLTKRYHSRGYGHTAKDIMIDKEKKLITFITKMGDGYDVPWDALSKDYILGADIQNSYNYSTDTLSKVLPKKDPIVHTTEDKVHLHVIQKDQNRRWRSLYKDTANHTLAITAIEDKKYDKSIHKERMYIRVYDIQDSNHVTFLREFETPSYEEVYGNVHKIELEANHKVKVTFGTIYKEWIKTYDYESGQEIK
jgi:hypothetical protein